MREALNTFEELGDNKNFRRTTTWIAIFLRNAGRLDEAKAEYTRALNLGGTTGNQAYCLEYLGMISTSQGLLDSAEIYLRQALRLDSELSESRKREAFLYNKLGQVLVAQGQSELAFRLCDSIRVKVDTSAIFSDRKRATRLVDCWDCIEEAQTALGFHRDALHSRDRRDSCRQIYETLDNANAADGLEVLEWETAASSGCRRTSTSCKRNARPTSTP